MNKKVIIIGAGGHGIVISDIIRLSGDTVIGFLDDEKTGTFNGCPILGKTGDSGQRDCCYFVAIGNNAVRQRIMDQDLQWYTAIHPKAVIAEDVTIGEGTAVMANAVINPGSSIGRGVIINTGATVDHDNVIRDFAHVSPGVHLAGTVTVGQRSWLGIGTNVINNVVIGSDVIIGAGSVVLRDVQQQGTFFGIVTGNRH